MNRSSSPSFPIRRDFIQPGLQSTRWLHRCSCIVLLHNSSMFTQQFWSIEISPHAILYSQDYKAFCFFRQRLNNTNVTMCALLI
ncbi:hypothetical protein GDO81_005480 [Engystomops pustulosus]|uniref:Uncharacterized protein n=1 Tax=Engystomops pustulosus TaxID=76066 RepID=A0AAV7CQU1_ENGPU|nr:hypothetical protein GDO81_005480 [Engystomops pustulosus]